MMRYFQVVLVLTFLAVVATASAQQRGQVGAPPAAPLMMSTSAFSDGGDIPPKYPQAGDQTSPALNWTNVPPGTMSFLLHFHDMEVARNKGTDDQVHWLVWNIPAT